MNNDLKNIYMKKKKKKKKKKEQNSTPGKRKEISYISWQHSLFKN